MAASDDRREARELLWAALAGGVIQMIGSDRSPVQLNLPMTWTEARARGYTLDQLAQWMCLAPARLAGLDRKGAIDVGFDADLVVFHPDAGLTVRRPPFAGRRLKGVIERTYLRGRLIYQNGVPIASPCGKLLLRLRAMLSRGHGNPRRGISVSSRRPGGVPNAAAALGCLWGPGAIAEKRH
ncbi:MAG TPA: amidohydrolase family protein [Vicinamibacterales bacterium]|nr:amidohydrolase family protein [Vicinamibacterales bacterium]